MDALDADVLIYAASPRHTLGSAVRSLIDGSADGELVGSELLVPELLIKPIANGWTRELAELQYLLARLHLQPADGPVTRLAAQLGATYRLKPVDAVHLATAVAVGATRFITNNRRDFGKDIEEIDVAYPDDL